MGQTSENPPKENVAQISRAALDEAHAALKPIAERSAHYDVRQLASVLLRLVETMRGDSDEQKTQVQPRHHV